MPLTHLACPETAPTYGEAHEPEYCLLECQNRCLSPFLIAGLMSSNSRNHHKGKLLSVTSLTGGNCTRSLVLERTEDYAMEPTNMLYSFRGTLAHQIIEEASQFNFPKGETLDEMGFLTEQRMLMAFCFEHGGFPAPEGSDPYDDTTWHLVSCPGCDEAKREQQDREWFFLSGTMDGFEPYWDKFEPEAGVLPGGIWDNKTAADYAINAVISGKDAAKNTYGHPAKDSYVAQGSLYKYLLERIPLPEGIRRAAAERGLEVKRLRVDDIALQYVSMMQFPRTGAATMFTDHYTRPKTPWQIPPLPVLDSEWAEEQIRSEGYAPYLGLILGKAPVKICDSDPTKEGGHNWKCGSLDKPGFCAFAFSELCPSPVVEWEALQEGNTQEQAFNIAQADRLAGFVRTREIEDALKPEAKPKKEPKVKKAASRKKKAE